MTQVLPQEMFKTQYDVRRSIEDPIYQPNIYVQILSRVYRPVVWVAVQVKDCVYRVAYVAKVCFTAIFPINPVTGQREFRVIPTYVECLLGAIHYEALCPAYRVSYNQLWNETVTDVGARLVDVCDRAELKYEFRVLRKDEEVNAFCLPGGKIAITTGLMQLLEEEKVGDEELDELPLSDKVAAVLGHEITHACAGHSAKRLQLSLLLGVAGKVLCTGLGYFISNKCTNPGDLQGSNRREAYARKERIQQFTESVSGIIWNLSTLLFRLKHGRQHEFQSDAVGMKYAVRAGFDPRAAIWLQKMFVKIHFKSLGGTLGAALDLFRSHPPSQERVFHCEKAWDMIQAGNVEQITG